MRKLVARRRALGAVLAGVVIGLGGCGGSPAPKSTAATPETAATTATGQPSSGQPAAAPAAPKELYDRLGGQLAIVAVVDDFINRVAGDKRINLRFLNTDIPRLKILLAEFVCNATGGKCNYTGTDMETAHAGMELVQDEFDALVEDLSATLDKFKVPAKEKGELLGALGPLAPLMVTPPDRLHPVSDVQIAAANNVLPKVTDPQAHDILEGAITAAKRGQRNYADQLFSRVEIMAGTSVVAAAAPAFRAGAPKRIDTPTTQMAKDTPPQPRVVGSSEDDYPVGPDLPASLKGTITVDGKPLQGVGLVSLYPQGTKFKKRTPKQRVVEQRNKQFLPHLLAIPPGSTVAFPNFDTFYHNVFSLSTTQPFDLGLFKDGMSRSMKFDKPGLVRLGCNVHAKMASFVFVVDAPAYVPVEGAKEFNFRSLASGKYKAVVWSEYSKEPTEVDIVLHDGVNTQTFDVKGDAEKGPSKDKFGNSRATTAQK